MKTRLFSFTPMLLVLCLAAFVSCDKEEIGADVDEVVGCSDADYFVGQFVSLDEEGNVALRLSGCLLNEADDTEISYCTEEWQEAVSMFKEWLPVGAVYQETESSLTWEMHDAEGNSLGNAVLSRKSGELVAEATLPATTPYVRTICFRPKAAWPENSAGGIAAGDLDTAILLEDYFVGNTIVIDTPPEGHDHGTGEFVVLREFDQNKNEKGILFRIQTTMYSKLAILYDYGPMKKRSRNLSDARTVSKLYIQKKEFLEPIIQDMESFGSRSVYVYGYEPNVGLFDTHDKSIKIESGQVRNWNMKNYDVYELDIYYFWAERGSLDSVILRME